MTSRIVPRLVFAVLLLPSAAVAAQNTAAPQVPVPTVTATPIPAPAPSAPILTISPTFDQSPVPVVMPTSRPTPRTARPQPTPTATPSPKASATPTPIPSPSPSPSSIPSRTPAPPATPAPLPTRLPIETVILPTPRTADPLWPWLVGGGALLIILLGAVALRRQPDEAADAEEPEPEPETLPDPVAPPPWPRLAVTLRPVRVGLNLISVTAECEVTIANTGGAPVEDVRAALKLTSAHDGQEAELAAFYAAPISRVPIPSFSLAPGEEHRFRLVTALPHDSIHALDVGGRPLFAALLALAVRYYDGHAPRRVGQAFALGGERGDAARLAPFWLDGGARTYDNVAARPHGVPVEN